MLKGKNIILRSLQFSDLSYLNKWRNSLDIKIMTQGYRLPVSLPRDEEWLKSKMLATGYNEVFFIIEESNVPIGQIQLTNIDYISGTAVWGFILGDESSRGKGYSVEAPLLLFNYAFNVLNLRKIIGYPLSLNKATFKMHQKIGSFKEEGCLKKHYYFNNQYHDVYILSFFKEDFKHLSFEL